MYEHGERDIDESSLYSIVKSNPDFVEKTVQLGIMGGLTYEGVRYFYFSIDSLTDFLIARSLFDDIKGKVFDEQVRIISEKSNTLYNLKEAFILAIFDSYTPNYPYIKRLLIETKLIEEIRYETLVKINYNKDSIVRFLEEFPPAAAESLLAFFGGYTDKPYNCVNYLNEYFWGENQLRKLTDALSDSIYIRSIKARLKNLLYFITLNNSIERRLEEAFYFSIWCCSAPNRDIRDLATKVLFEVICREEKYIDLLISNYFKIEDLYIRESIIYTLAFAPTGNISIQSFFRSLANREDSLTAKSIKRISTYLGDDYGYIMWNRKNLYQYEKNAQISEFLDKWLFRIDLIDKYFMPFRYRGKDHVTLGEKFISNNKKDILAINAAIQRKFSCVKNGECSGRFGLEKKCRELVYPDEKIELLDTESYLCSFERAVRKCFNSFQLKAHVDSLNLSEEQFNNSLARKCFDIALGVFQGSLMCNYFTAEFGSFNNFQNNIGYEVFDPLEYGERMNITSPIATFHDQIKIIADSIVARMNFPLKKDIAWVKNSSITRTNILSLIAPVENNGTEWVLLAGKISMGEMDDHTTEWKDTYDWWCCTSETETITESDARYLTIELEEYTGNILDYDKCEIKPWLCKRMNTILSDSNLFDETGLVLPPAEIIRHFSLQVCIADMSWRTPSGEIVILCDNNKNSYLSDPVGGTVFMRKSYYDDFVVDNPIKFFAFTERFIPETGYADETAIHFEVQNGKIIKEIFNDYRGTDLIKATNPECEDCPYEISWNRNIPTKLNELIAKYQGKNGRIGD